MAGWIRRLVSMALVSIAAAGCHCCDPCHMCVDYEGFCHFMNYHSSDCCEYPFSCPACPYYDYETCQWRNPRNGRAVPCCTTNCDCCENCSLFRPMPW